MKKILKTIICIAVIFIIVLIAFVAGSEQGRQGFKDGFDRGLNGKNVTDISELQNDEFEKALKDAKMYDNLFHFSEKRLYGQLIYEGYSEEAVQYAIDKANIDYELNAWKVAKELKEDCSISSDIIYEMLTSDYKYMFRPNEAKYAIDNLF